MVKHRMDGQEGWSVAILWFLVAMALVAGGSVAAPSGKKPKAPESPSREELRAGRRLYRTYCATCHGREGDGKGPSAGALRPRPRDFTRGLYKFRTTPTGGIPTDEDLYLTISRGIPGTAMPSWDRLLSVEERMEVVQVLKTFSKRFRHPAKAPVEIPEVPDWLDSKASSRRGEAVFERLQCFKCHGMKGREPKKDLRDDWDEPMQPYDFRKRPKGGDRPEDLFRVLVTGLNGTPMPAYADSMTPEEVWDVVSYVRSLRRTPNLLEWLFEEPTDPW